MTKDRRGRVKVCRFCEGKIAHIDYKDERLLQRFISDRGKIIPRRMSGVCERHQRQLTRAIKRARQIAIVPFVADSMR